MPLIFNKIEKKNSKIHAVKNEKHHKNRYIGLTAYILTEIASTDLI